IGQVVAIVARERRAEDDQIKLALVQGLLDGFPSDRCLYAKSPFLKEFRLAAQDLFVLFSVKNSKRRAGFRHSGSSIETLATGWRLGNVTEDHRRTGKNGCLRPEQPQGQQVFLWGVLNYCRKEIKGNADL